MDREISVEPWRDRGQRLLANILQTPAVHSVASASWALFVPRREGAREMPQPQITLEAPSCPCGRGFLR